MSVASSQQNNHIVSDEDIIELFWLRNEKAIEETNKKYGSLVYSIAFNILNNVLDSEECQNDTYLSLWNSIPPTRPISFPAFITRIARNIAINRFHKNHNKKSIPSDFIISIEELSHQISVEEQEFNSCQDLADILSKFLLGLPKRQRYIFIAKYYRAEPIKVIANEIGVTKMTIHRDLTKIKSELKHFLQRNEVII